MSSARHRCIRDGSESVFIAQQPGVNVILTVPSLLSTSLTAAACFNAAKRDSWGSKHMIIGSVRQLNTALQREKS